MSIIDRYLTFIRVAQHICICSQDDYLLRRLARSLELLNATIKDYRIGRMLLFLGVTSELACSDESLALMRLLDEYTFGNYEKTVVQATKLLADGPFDITIASILAKANSRAGLPHSISRESSVASRILRLLQDLTSDRQQLLEAREALLKICYMHKSHDWSSDLYRFVLSECDTSSGIEVLPAERFALLNTKLLNPHFALATRDPVQGKVILEEMLRKCGDSVTLRLIQACLLRDREAVERLQINSGRSLKYQAEILEVRGQLQEARDRYRELMRSNDPTCKEDARLGLIRVLLGSGELAECMDLAAEFLIANGALYRLVDVSKILNAVNNAADDELKKRIALPILYDIFNKQQQSVRDIKSLEAYEDFLMLNQISKPLELRKNYGQFRQIFLLYFLRYVCIQKVMDISPIFSGGSEEVEIERMGICQALVEMDPENESIYMKEIEGITSALVLAKQQHLVQSRKIYVDIEQLKNALSTSLSDQYQRYCALPPGKYPDAEEKYITNTLFGVELSQPTSEKEHLLLLMFDQVRQQFAMNQQYGLNVALSAEIRHGNIASYLRNPLEEAHLVTRIGRDGKYMDSVYWREQYNYVNDKLIEKIIERLKRFSEDVDVLISAVKDQWIQIQLHPLATSNLALFDFCITQTDAFEIKRMLQPNTTFDEFFDILLARLWNQTDRCLVFARQRIGEDLLNMLLNKLDDLTSDIRQIKSGTPLNDLENSILSGRVGIQRAIEEIVGWFSRSQQAECPDFQLQIPIDIAINAAKATCANRPAEFMISLPKDEPIQGRLLKPLTNVFIMLFVNAIEHCGLDEGVKINVCAARTDETIHISVRNLVGPLVDHNLLEAKLAEKRAALQEGAYGEFASREGGSGLFKIYKILLHDTSAAASFSFLLDASDYFQVSIELNRECVVRESPNH